MVLKIKDIPSFKRGDHAESKYLIRNEFYPFLKYIIGHLTEN